MRLRTAHKRKARKKRREEQERREEIEMFGWACDAIAELCRVTAKQVS